jgi:ribonuclease BN (tRNA processing enzyme)
MRCWVQVVGLATGDSVPAVVVGTEGSRYLFNAGEGLQRFCTEHRVRLVKVDGIFFSAVDTERLGGLPGMLLTLADMGKKSLRLFGGPGLANYLFATRHFMRRGDVAVEARELPPKCAAAGGGVAPSPVVFPDLTVEPVLVGAHDPAQAARAAAATSLAGFYDRVLTGSARLSSRFANHPQQQTQQGVAAAAVPGDGASSSPAGSTDAARDIQGPFNPLNVGWWPGTAAAAPGGAPTPLPALAAEPSEVAAALPPSRYATSYVVTTPPITGKFHVAAARALGLPPGPLYGQLQRGRAVDARIPVDTALARGLVTPEAAEAARREHEAAVAAAAAAQAAAAAAAAATAAAAAAAAAAAELAAASPAATVAPASPASISDAAPPAAKRRKGDGAGAATAAATTAPPAHATVSVRITPAMVKDDDVPGQAALIAACPSPAFLPALADAPQLARFYTPSPDSTAVGPPQPPWAGARLRAVYHLCPPDVAELPAYRTWLARFPRDVTHVFTCVLPASLVGGHGAVPTADGGAPPPPPPFQPLLHAAQAHQLVKLHVLHPPAFPLPHPLPAQAAAALAAATAASPASGSGTEAAASRLTPLQQVALRLLASDDPAQAAAALAATLAPPPAPPSVDPSTTGAIAVGGGADGASHTVHSHPRLQVVQATPLHQYMLTPLPALPAASTGGSDTGSAAAIGAAAAVAAPAVNAAVALGEMVADSDMAAYLRGALTEAASSTEGADGATAACGHMPVDGDDDGGGCGCAAAAADAALGADVPPGVAVTFTGTASAVPSKYRNVSGIYVQLPPVAATATTTSALAAAPAAAPAVLLDCGEGTHGQLCRRFGLPGSTTAAVPTGGTQAADVDPCHSDAAVAALRVAWISHMHADHHLGLPRVIAQRARALREAAGEGRPHLATPPLLVVGPTRLYQWLQEASVIDPGLLDAWTFADAAHFEVLPSASSPVAAPSSAAAPEPTGDGAGCGPEGDDAVECTPLAASSASTAAAPASSGAAAAASAVAAGFPPTMMRPLFIPLAGEDEGDSAALELAQQQQQPYHHRASREYVTRTLAECGIARLAAIHVVHCARAYALRLDVAASSQQQAVQKPWSLVYSGDTRPCAQVVALGRGEVVPARPAATLLPPHPPAPPSSSPPFGRASLIIHEATFEDTPDGAANAVDKRHSTVSEALGVAAAVPARHTLLTHFSARYPKLPVLKLDGAGSSSSGGGDDAAVTAGEDAEAAAVAAGRTIFVAYDLMTVRGGGHLAALPRLLQPLHLLFREEEALGEGEGEEGDDEEEEVVEAGAKQ